METVEIGRTGRPHGTRGELSLIVEEPYEDDLLAAKVILIGKQALPYPVVRFIGGGKLRVQLRGYDRREQVQLLAGKPLLLPADRVTAESIVEGTPWDELIGYRVEAEGYPIMGPIAAIVDMPEHYLGELIYEGRTVYLPLHEDLVVGIREEDTVLVLDLPGGLLDL